MTQKSKSPNDSPLLENQKSHDRDHFKHKLDKNANSVCTSLRFPQNMVAVAPMQWVILLKWRVKQVKK